MTISLPGPQNRLAVVGSTGSGKTVAALWHLSNADLLDRPWVIFDFKKDENIAALAAKQLPLNTVPTKPGLYVYRPKPVDDDKAVNDLLRKIWEQTNIGIWIDEGYMISGGSRNGAFNTLLTQGRSLNIQMIICSQRPAWMSRFVFSEADFMQVFRLNDTRDYGTIRDMTGLDFTKRLPSYHSHYFDVAANEGVVFKPVPKRQEVIGKINRRLKSTMGMI